MAAAFVQMFRTADGLRLHLQHLTAGVPAKPGDSVAMLPTKACKTAADAFLARQVCDDQC